MTEHKELYVQYGCGFSAPFGWLNFDASPTLRFEKLPIIGSLYTRNEKRFPENVQYGNILSGLPVNNNSCSAVYCSHVLEHLSLNDLRIAMANTYSIIRPGGIFRLVMPDLEYYIEEYNRSDSADAAIIFMKMTLLGVETRKRRLRGVVHQWLGNSRHLWLWDFAAIKMELEQVGFTGVRRAFMGDSSEKMFQSVEERQRWKNALGVECRKPA